jgi:hypothetical protein
MPGDATLCDGSHNLAANGIDNRKAAIAFLRYEQPALL